MKKCDIEWSENRNENAAETGSNILNGIIHFLVTWKLCFI